MEPVRRGSCPERCAFLSSRYPHTWVREIARFFGYSLLDKAIEASSQSSQSKAKKMKDSRCLSSSGHGRSIHTPRPRYRLELSFSVTILHLHLHGNPSDYDPVFSIDQREAPIKSYGCCVCVCVQVVSSLTSMSRWGPGNFKSAVQLYMCYLMSQYLRPKPGGTCYVYHWVDMLFANFTGSSARLTIAAVPELNVIRRYPSLPKGTYTRCLVTIRTEREQSWSVDDTPKHTDHIQGEFLLVLWLLWHINITTTHMKCYSFHPRNCSTIVYTVIVCLTSREWLSLYSSSTQLLCKYIVQKHHPEAREQGRNRPKHVAIQKGMALCGTLYAKLSKNLMISFMIVDT